MSENTVPVTEQFHPADDRPGHRLAEARRAKGLSLEEVASQLRLNVTMLQALENDDYSHLPPAAYVSGYLRSYARALGLSETEVLRGNVAAPSGEPPIVGVVARSQTSQVQASDPRVRMVTLIVLGGLLFVSSAWWLVQSDEPALPPVEETAAAAPGDADGVAPAVGAEGAVAPVDSVAAAPAATAPAVGPAPVPVAVPPRPVPPAPVAAKPAVVTPPPEPAASPTAEMAPRPELPPPPPLTAATPQSSVVIELTADCWVDVVDAAGRQLAYELATAGRKMRLHGEAPFTVFFGYSPGVQVTFNDQPFDHRPFQRKDVARFKLGTAEDNAQPTDAQ